MPTAVLGWRPAVRHRAASRVAITSVISSRTASFRMSMISTSRGTKAASFYDVTWVTDGKVSAKGVGMEVPNGGGLAVGWRRVAD